KPRGGIRDNRPHQILIDPVAAIRAQPSLLPPEGVRRPIALRPLLERVLWRETPDPQPPPQPIRRRRKRERDGRQVDFRREVDPDPARRAAHLVERPRRLPFAPPVERQPGGTPRYPA